jgi:hypothetical protein
MFHEARSAWVWSGGRPGFKWMCNLLHFHSISKFLVVLEDIPCFQSVTAQSPNPLQRC